MTKAELIELLKKARKQLKKYHVPKDEQTITLSIDTIENALSEQPEIIPCKDCKNAVLWVDNEKYHCLKEIGYDTGVHEQDWFCADGERK